MKSRGIRFRPVNCGPDRKPNTPDTPVAEIVPGRRQVKSRSGCLCCKLRRVKCDETFPTCKRCQKRGSICLAVPRLDQWQMELPCLLGGKAEAPSPLGSILPLSSASCIDQKLLKQWMQRTCHIIVVDTGNANPLSFPIIEHFGSSVALVHVLQSISAAHSQFFEQTKLGPSLQERSKALLTLRDEISNEKSLILTALVSFLLGISSTFIDDTANDYGKEHLFATHQMIETILSNKKAHSEPLTHFVVGAFIYYDMSCSLLVEPDEQRHFDTAQIEDCLSTMRDQYHCITGVYTELFYLLANIGRHCRYVMEHGKDDIILTNALKTKLVNFTVPQDEDFWSITANAYKYSGLILLYRYCDYSPSANEEETDSEMAIERTIQQYARRIVRYLMAIPVESHFLNLQAIPLLTAGAELLSSDQPLRDEITTRFKALFSLNRLPSNITAISLLEELWHLRHLGIELSFLDLMFQKNWRLRVG